MLKASLYKICVANNKPYLQPVFVDEVFSGSLRLKCKLDEEIKWDWKCYKPDLFLLHLNEDTLRVVVNGKII